MDLTETKDDFKAIIMKQIKYIKVLVLIMFSTLFLNSCKDQYKAADLNKKMEMAELVSSISGTPEAQAFMEIFYSSVELGADGFKFTATKKDFVDRGLDTYYYYAMKDSLKETYRSLTKGKLSVPGMENVDWIQEYIETYNKQKEEFWAEMKK